MIERREHEQIPISFRHFSATAGDIETSTPNAVKHQRCAAAAGRAVAVFRDGQTGAGDHECSRSRHVEGLGTTRSVPAVSMKQLWFVLMPTARARMPSANPASSSTVSPSTSKR